MSSKQIRQFWTNSKKNKAKLTRCKSGSSNTPENMPMFLAMFAFGFQEYINITMSSQEKVCKAKKYDTCSCPKVTCPCYVPTWTC